MSRARVLAQPESRGPLPLIAERSVVVVRRASLGPRMNELALFRRHPRETGGLVSAQLSLQKQFSGARSAGKRLTSVSPEYRSTHFVRRR